MNRCTDNWAVCYMSDKYIYGCVELWLGVVFPQYLVFILSVRAVGSLATWFCFDQIGLAFYSNSGYITRTSAENQSEI